MTVAYFVVTDEDSGENITHEVEVNRASSIRDIFDRPLTFVCNGRKIWPDEQFGGIVSDNDSDYDFFSEINGNTFILEE